MAYGSGQGHGAGPVGSIVRYGPTGRAQRVKTGGYQWSEEAEDAFFDHLSASCNVRASAEAVGFTAPTVYRQRRLRPDFAARWQAALEQGYARLEMALLQAAADTIEGVEFDDERPIPKMSVDQAMGLLRAHGPAVRADGTRNAGKYAPVRDVEYFRESILKKIAAIKAARRETPANGDA